MHLLIECLPLLAGPVMLVLFRLMKATFYRNICLLLMPMLFAVAANFLSGEGISYLPVDLLKVGANVGSFLMLRNAARKLWLPQ